jgi:hypothetical protein
MREQPEYDGATTAGDRRFLALSIAVLVGTGAIFRLVRLSSVPGISGDEGWWGIQATALLAGRPYETHTTSGNPTDLVFLVPLALLHAIAPPSFLLLRILPAFANLLALPVGFWFVRRLYDNTTAWIYTVTLAILPTAIAHSRICQDPSQTVFWTGVVILLSMLGFKDRSRAWRYGLALLLVFPVALWTHPTNLFLAPFLILPCVTAIRPALPASPRSRALLFASMMILLVLGLLAAWFAVGYLAPSNDYLSRPWLSIAAARLIDGRQWFEFAANNGRLFNGVTVYHYFSGARPATVPYDAAFVLVAGTLLAGLLTTIFTKRPPLDVGLVLACAGTWLGFYAIAGPQALRPHFERWGLCLIVPGTLVLARGLAAWIEWMPGRRRPIAGTAVLLAAALLTTFHVNYFREFATSGGRSHLTYVTAATEPKQQAFQYILSRTDGPAAVSIVSQQWWIARPIAYLALDHPNVSVGMTLDEPRQDSLQAALANGRLFFVEFVATKELAGALDWIRQRDLRVARRTIQDAGGRDLLEILQVAPAR